MSLSVKNIIMAAMIGFTGMCFLCNAAETMAKVEVIHPFLRVPEMKKAPIIDGRLNVDEWTGAAVFTGISGSPLTTPFMLPECQQVVWYLGFFEDKIYIGMKSPHPKGSFPKGRIKEPDNAKVLFEDHAEIQLCKYTPSEATIPGKGFYKMVVNPWGAMHDRHWYNGTPDSEDIWSTGGEVKCAVTDSEWQMELSVSAKNMNLKELDAAKLLVQLVRASDTGGVYFAGWIGASWLEFSKFAECDFDRKAPAIQFEKIGEIMEGKINSKFTVIGNDDKKIAVAIELTVENAEEKTVYKEMRNVSVANGEKAEAIFEKSDIPVSEVGLAGTKRNYFQINVTYMDGNVKRILYFNRSPFMKMTEEWKSKYLEPWISSRQLACEWEAGFANWIYSGKALGSVDTEFFGISRELQDAQKFSVEVKAKDAPEVITRAESPMKNMKGKVLFNMPQLNDGDYEAVFKLYDQAGKKVGQRSVPFIRKRFPFEHNMLGKSDEVIPPFWPLEADPGTIRGGCGKYGSKLPKNSKDTVNAWGRVYQFGGLGLFKQVWTTPPTGAVGGIEELLSAPITIEVKKGGRKVELKEADKVKLDIKPHRADVVGGAVSDIMDIQVKGFEEYDGWYEVEMALIPKNPVAIDSFDIVIDMRDEKGDRSKAKFPVDTLIAQRLGMGSDSYYGGIPEKPGVHFKSTSLSGVFERNGPADIAKDWKSFVPVTYIGNGDRGLYFFAWSDIGWEMKDNDPAVTVERMETGNVRLKIRILSGLAKFDRPRKIRFAMQAAPVKSNDPHYRSVVDSIIHDTSGYRYYGDSVDGYCLDKEEDYDQLRKYILYDAKWSSRVRDLDFSNLVMYGSQWMTGCGSEEFKTFGGEWLGKNNWKPDPALTFNKRWNLQHTDQWMTPEQLTAARVNWSKSMLDFFIYYYNKHLSKSGFNGTWWDNCYSGLITEYDPETDGLDSKWNFYSRRELCKRLNVIGWQMMRRPCWLMGTPEMELSWNQVHWMVEGFWSSPAQNLSIWQNWNVDFMRSQIRPKGSIMISKAFMHGYTGTTADDDERVKRSVVAVMLLHDVTPSGFKYVYAGRDEIIHKLRYVVNYDNTRECLYMGYWGSGQFVKPSVNGILASFYQNSKRKAAVIVFANTTGKNLDIGGTSFSPAGMIDNPKGEAAAVERHLDVRKVYDLETGDPLKTTYRNGWLVIDEQFVVKKDEFRLLAVEAAK